MMQAITLWEPWASLVAIGAKQFETRSWAPPSALRGQRIAIHAARRWTAEQRREAERLLRLSSQWNQLWILLAEWRHQQVRWRPPTLGRVLCTVRLGDWWMIRRGARYWEEARERVRPKVMRKARNNEWAFGNYSPGGFAWELQDVELCVPTAVRGAQKFWTWEG